MLSCGMLYDGDDQHEIIALCGSFAASESKARSVDSVAKITNITKF